MNGVSEPCGLPHEVCYSVYTFWDFELEGFDVSESNEKKFSCIDELIFQSVHFGEIEGVFNRGIHNLYPTSQRMPAPSGAKASYFLVD